MVSTPLKNSQLGKITTDIWKNKNCSKPPTRQSFNHPFGGAGVSTHPLVAPRSSPACLQDEGSSKYLAHLQVTTASDRQGAGPMGQSQKSRRNEREKQSGCYDINFVGSMISIDIFFPSHVYLAGEHLEADGYSEL